MWPLQLVLRQIILMVQEHRRRNLDRLMQPPLEGVKNAVIVFGTVPILADPFLQKHFVKGIMI